MLGEGEQQPPSAASAQASRETCDGPSECPCTARVTAWIARQLGDEAGVLALLMMIEHVPQRVTRIEQAQGESSRVGRIRWRCGDGFSERRAQLCGDTPHLRVFGEVHIHPPAQTGLRGEHRE